MKRLVRKAAHDWYNRDTAIVVFGDKIYEDLTHGVCLQRYLDDEGEDKEIYLGDRPQVKQFQEVSKKDNGQCVILAHRVDNSNTIYYIYGYSNGAEMSNSEIESKLASLFPDKQIINDLDHVDDGNNNGYNKEELIENGQQKLQEFEQEKQTKKEDTIKTYEQIVKENTDSNVTYTMTEGSNLHVRNENFQIYLNLSYNGTVTSNDFVEINTEHISKGSFNKEDLEIVMNELNSLTCNVTNLLKQNGWTFDAELNAFQKQNVNKVYEITIDTTEKLYTFFTNNRDVKREVRGEDMMEMDKIDNEKINLIESFIKEFD